MLSSFVPKEYESGEDIKIFEDRWRSSKLIRDRLKEVFNGKLETIVNQEEGLEGMKDPNWVARQAYHLGQRSAIRDFIKYLDQRVDNE